MPFEEFANRMQKELQEKLGESARVRLHDLHYNNDGNRRAICVLSGEGRAAPAIWLEPLYRRFLGGESWEEIAADLLRELREKAALPAPQTELSDWDAVAELVRPMLVNTERNGFRRGRCPHRELLDLTIFYYLLVEMGEDASGLIVIENSHCRTWGIGEEELWETAVRNMAGEGPFRGQSLEEAVLQLADPAFGGEEFPEEERHLSIYVLTNERKRMGAAVVLLPGGLRSFCLEKNWKGAFLLPSSVHEMLILPRGCGVAPEDIRSIIRQVNEEVVSAEDWLSDSLYCYDPGEDRISVWEGETAAQSAGDDTMNYRYIQN